MSRSRKKHPIIKDNGQSHKWNKKNANQRIRTAVRNVLTNLDSYEDKIFPTPKGKELTNQCDICDWKWRLDEHIIRDGGYSYGNGMWFKYTKRDIIKYLRK